MRAGAELSERGRRQLPALSEGYWKNVLIAADVG